MTRRALGLLAALVAAAVTQAVAQVDPSGAWRTLRTAHFRIHYQQVDSATAPHAAREAERAWALLAAELVRPRGTVDLVLSSAADFSNGSATTYPANRVTILLPPPAAQPGLQRYDDWLRLVITHELAHVFHLDRVRGPWRAAQYVFGRLPGTFPNEYQPSWVKEGLAIHYETRFTAAGRLRGTYFDQLLGAAAQGGRWPAPNQATFLSPRWPAGAAPYAWGGELFGRVHAEAGDTAVAAFVRRTSGQWLPFLVQRPMRQAAGAPLDSLWGDLRRAAPPAAAAIRRGEVVVDSLRAPASPVVGASGVLAWFAAANDRPAEIRVRRADGTLERRTSTAYVDLAWRGDTLYATQADFSTPVRFRSDLHRWDGTRWHRVTRDARLTDLAAGPAGVVAVQLAAGENRLVRVVRDGCTGDACVEPITGVAPGTQWASPALAPDGRLAAVRHRAAGYELVVASAPGDTAWRVVASSADGILADPAWSPDGRWLLYVSDRTGLPQVYGLAAGDAAHRQLTTEPAGAIQPAVGPDGTLYVAALDVDGYAVRRLPLEGETLAAQPPTTPPEYDQPVAEPEPAAVGTPTGYRPWGGLRPHFWVPYLADGNSLGWALGAQVTGTDAIRRTSYTAILGVFPEGGQVNGSLYVRHQRWRRAAVDLYARQDWDDVTFRTASGAVAVAPRRQRDASVGLNLLWRSWWRSLSMRVAGDYEADQFPDTPALRQPEFVGASAALGVATLQASPLSISTERGLAAQVRYRYRWRLDRDGWSDEWRGRLLGYAPIRWRAGFAPIVLAARVAAGVQSGPARDDFDLGGTAGGQVVAAPGIVFGTTRSFPVRGYEGGELQGTGALSASAEVRVPVALVASTLGKVPVGLDRLSATAFADYGYGWEPRFGQGGSLASVGVELGWDLGVLYDYTFRLRTIGAVPLRDGPYTASGSPWFGVALGADF